MLKLVPYKSRINDDLYTDFMAEFALYGSVQHDGLRQVAQQLRFVS